MKYKKAMVGLNIDKKQIVYGDLLRKGEKFYIVKDFEMENVDGENTDLYATDWSEIIPETLIEFNHESREKEFLDIDTVEKIYKKTEIIDKINELIENQNLIIEEIKWMKLEEWYN